MKLKNLIDNTPVILSISTAAYMILLIFASPFIDHLFTPLEEYEKNTDNNINILSEIIIHVVVLALFWHYANQYLQLFLERMLKIKMSEITQLSIKFISSLALLGLQRNLLDKLKYITYEHPFRM